MGDGVTDRLAFPPDSPGSPGHQAGRRENGGPRAWVSCRLRIGAIGEVVDIMRWEQGKASGGPHFIVRDVTVHLQ